MSPRRTDIPVGEVIGEHPHVEAIRQIPELWAIEQALLELRTGMAAGHYALGAALVRHGLHESADLVLHEESAKQLRELDHLRDRLRAARHAISRGLE